MADQGNGVEINFPCAHPIELKLVDAFSMEEPRKRRN